MSSRTFLVSVTLVATALMPSCGAGHERLRHEAFATLERFMVDLSRRWELDDCRDSVAAELVDQMRMGGQSAELKERFAHLGEVRNVHDFMELQIRSKVGPDGLSNTGTYRIRADFAKAQIIVVGSLLERGGTVEIGAFQIFDRVDCDTGTRQVKSTSNGVETCTYLGNDGVVSVRVENRNDFDVVVGLDVESWLYRQEDGRPSRERCSTEEPIEKQIAGHGVVMFTVEGGCRPRPGLVSTSGAALRDVRRL